MITSTRATRWGDRDIADWSSPTPGSAAFSVVGSTSVLRANAIVRSLFADGRWIGTAETQIKDAFLLADNWDGQGAAQIGGAVTEHALEFAHALASFIPFRPSIVPCPDGAIAFEWPELASRPSAVIRDAEIEFCYLDRVSGRYIEATLADDAQACSALRQAMHE